MVEATPPLASGTGWTALSPEGSRPKGPSEAGRTPYTSAGLRALNAANMPAQWSESKGNSLGFLENGLILASLMYAAELNMAPNPRGRRR